jgi:hypothetical protein
MIKRRSKNKKRTKKAKDYVSSLISKVELDRFNNEERGPYITYISIHTNMPLGGNA